jgi:ribosomal protein S6--L-glutamate ligase
MSERKPRRLPPRVGKWVAILSRKPSLYSTRRLIEAAAALGHRPVVMDTLRCSPVLATSVPRLTYGGIEIRGAGVAIPRIGASITGYGLSVVQQLEAMGVPMLNGSVPIARSRDKLRCLQWISQHGIEIPRTVMARDRSVVPKLVEEVGGLPAIIKLVRGTQGVGVMIASSMAELQSILDTFWDLGQEIVLQEFIRESRGRDIRALVVGGRVIGAMQRRAKPGEFRSNLHRGGEGHPILLEPAYASAAIGAAQALGLELAGVDLLEGKSGPRVIEVNSSPGFEGLEAATGLNVAGAVMTRALELGSMPSDSKLP